MKNVLLAAGVLLAGTASLASAQTPSNDEVATYTAIVRTPIGALSPMLTNTLLNRLQNGASLAVRYGNLAKGDFNANSNAFALTGILPAGLGSSLTLTAGVILNETSPIVGAPETRGQLILGVGGDIRLIGRTMGNTAASPLWTVSLDGELGYGNANPGTYFGGYVGVPIALVQRGEGMQFVPFLTPGFAFAQNSANGTSTSGSGLMVGGGLGIYNMMSSVTVNVAVQHQFMNGARNTIGINLLLGGK
ncbi:MAG: hypothetical protein ABIR92_01770 [Gemmatimonadaceae bacterium]